MANESILIVDDNEMNVKLLRWVLEKSGYQVHTAGDAKTARAAIRAVRPRLVLMDIQLPDIDGLQLTREFKADPSLRDIPVVAVTSYAMKSDRQKTIDAGCDGYITKPIDTRQFPLDIEKYLRGPRGGSSG
jgi:CheY-like chemotaxis protein